MWGRRASLQEGGGGGGGANPNGNNTKGYLLNLIKKLGNMLIQHIGDKIEDCTPYQSTEFKPTQEIRTSD